MQSKATLKKELILKAATEFVLEYDFHSLTLETVAKQAGISKGGLLYHFPTKQALLQELAQYIFQEFTNQFNQQANKDPDEKGKWSRALINASLWDLENNNAKLNIGIYAASTLNPEIAQSIAHLYQYVTEKQNLDGIDPVKAAVIRLAIDGLYYSQLFNIAPIDKELRKDVIHYLLNITE